jgi:hypothetical protein
MSSSSGSPPGKRPPGEPPPLPSRAQPRPAAARAQAIPSIAPVIPSIAPVSAKPASASGRPSRPAGAQGRPASSPAAALLTQAQLRELAERHQALERLDYFELLKLPKTATPDEIKAAFYRESRQYHPDRFFQLQDEALKERVHEVYKRIIEAYAALRDDAKRAKYLTDVTGPERAVRLRFTEAAEAESKQAQRRAMEEQLGQTAKGRQFFQNAQADLEAGRLAAAERNLKMALTFEPQNARFKSALADVQQRLSQEAKASGSAFKIR